MDDVKLWLNSAERNYAEGVALYLKHGRDNILRNLFTKEGESAFKRERLAVALKDIWQHYKHPTSPKAALQRIIEKQNPAANFKYWPENETDEVLTALRNQWKPKYAEMMHLQARLYEVAEMGEKDPDKRLEASTIAHRILDLDDICDEIYAKRDYYMLHGHLPTTIIEDPEPVGDPVKWALKLQNANRYIRLYRNRMEQRPGDEKAATLFKKYLDEADKYKKLLKC